ncbi:MAG: hypothetical protein R3C18_19185 [Planctomycetaceae bacterium]
MSPLAILNQLTVTQRKIVYAVVGALMLLPILILGSPADKLDKDGTPIRSGGYLAQMRFDDELGEASLGNVDPTSSAMSFGLLGFRGIVACMLWSDADDLKQRKEFAQLERKVESIIELQPHFRQVWEFQGWNLAFNVSTECDDVRDRYKWVKKGAKFMMRGTERNRRVPELHWQTGYFFGHKIGSADEKDAYRRFFIADPDENDPDIFGKNDPEINPEGKGNYEVARDWYLQTNALVLSGREQHQMDEPLILAYPSSALIEHADSIQEDGVQPDGMQLARHEDILEALAELSYDDDPEKLKEKQARLEAAYDAWKERCQTAWEKAYDSWVTDYGRMRLRATDLNRTKFILEIDEDEVEHLAKLQDVQPEVIQGWRTRYRKTTNYPTRKQRCHIESQPKMTEARYKLAEGKRLFTHMSDFQNSRRLLLDGLKDIEEVVLEYNRADGSNGVLVDEPDIVRNIIKSQILLEQAYLLSHEKPPEEFPLKDLVWNSQDSIIQDIKLESQQAYQAMFGYLTQ